MRPPFGRHNAEIDATLASLGYVVTMWNQDSGDTWGIPFEQEQANFYNAPNNGSEVISLSHDVQVLTYQNLVAWVINWVQQRGLR